MPVYFIRSNQIDQKKIHLDTALEHHLRNVLRLKMGEAIFLVDEQRKRYLARVMTTHPKPMTLQIESEALPPADHSPKIRLGVALIQREKMDWIIQKATELGVARISPVITARTVVRPDPKRSVHQVERWGKIAREAAQQSCRFDIPSVDVPVSLQHLFSEPELQAAAFRFIFAERFAKVPCPSDREKTRERAFESGEAAESEGSPRSPLAEMCRVMAVQKNRALGPVDSGLLLIGPEGGWTSEELTQAIGLDFLPLSLGARILRTETAVLAALAILDYEISNGNDPATFG